MRCRGASRGRGRRADRPAPPGVAGRGEGPGRGRSSTGTTYRASRLLAESLDHSNPSKKSPQAPSISNTYATLKLRDTRREKAGCQRADSAERRHHLTGDQVELTHDVGVLHPGEERAADQVGHAVRLDEAADLGDARLGPADDEAVFHEPVQIGRAGRVDERVAPAAGVLLAVGDHDVPLGELARLRLRVRDDDVAGQRPVIDRRRPPGRAAVVAESTLALEEALEVGGRARDPVVPECCGALERELTPAADPDRRGGLLPRRWVPPPPPPGGKGPGSFPPLPPQPPSDSRRVPPT